MGTSRKTRQVSKGARPRIMKFGVYVPVFDEYADPRVLVALAREAEAAGWDGFFVWDHIYWQGEVIPFADPWIALAAIAAQTWRIRLGPMVTPLPRRRPTKLARESVTLDHLSSGRLILGLGLGAASEGEFEAFGDSGDLRRRARELEEGLSILAGLWSGEPFEFSGERYRVGKVQFLPKPLQSPRIPVWLAGTWDDKRAAIRRAAAWDGIFPTVTHEGPMTPSEVREMVAYIRQHRASQTRFDVAIWNESGDDAADDVARVREYADAGLTWWLESYSGYRFPLAQTFERIRRGPPQGWTTNQVE